MRMRWGQNFSLLILSLLLAFFFWAVATEAENPMEEKAYPTPIAVEIRNVPEDMIPYGYENVKVRVVLRAPTSLWSILQAQLGDIQAFVDLTGAEPGAVTVPVQVTVSRKPVQVMQISPDEVTFTLDKKAEREIPVEITLEGNPALGFVARAPIYTPRTVTVRGPQSRVSQTTRALITVPVAEKRQSVQQDFQAVPVDETNVPVEDVEIVPRTITVEVPVEQLGNIRDLAVSVTLSGNPAPGYRVSSVEVEPPVVTVTGRRDVVQATGVSLGTEPVPLQEAGESFTTTVGLQLPEGLSVLTTPQVLVTVNLEQLESRLNIPLTPEIRGLSAGLTATLNVETIQVIVVGPFQTVEALDPRLITATLALQGLPEGTHTVVPEIGLPDATLRIEDILPQSSVIVTLQAVQPED